MPRRLNTCVACLLLVQAMLALAFGRLLLGSQFVSRQHGMKLDGLQAFDLLEATKVDLETIDRRLADARVPVDKPFATPWDMGRWLTQSTAQQSVDSMETAMMFIGAAFVLNLVPLAVLFPATRTPKP